MSLLALIGLAVIVSAVWFVLSILADRYILRGALPVKTDSQRLRDLQIAVLGGPVAATVLALESAAGQRLLRALRG